jgi:hypothetical protein
MFQQLKLIMWLNFERSELMAYLIQIPAMLKVQLTNVTTNSMFTYRTMTAIPFFNGHYRIIILLRQGKIFYFRAAEFRVRMNFGGFGFVSIRVYSLQFRNIFSE